MRKPLPTSLTACGLLLLMATAAVAELPYAGTADPAATVVSGQARFTVLTPTLLRLEWSPDAGFEDRPTLFAVRRNLPVPHFTQEKEEGWLIIETDGLQLRYAIGTGRFTADNLSIRALNTEQPIQWTLGTPNRGNLGGTVRTLDQCRGPIRLEEGVLSRDGWYLLDDSESVVFGGTAEDPWPAPRPAGEHIDWYFFGYGTNYAQALGDLTTVGDPIPLPPRFAFGSWYSRYWPYTSEDFLAIANGYRDRGYPLDVMVIDMDWHLEGWTGYTWNRELIPDPKGLLDSLHERGLKVTLNLHPHSGVSPHERAYEAFSKAMGVDPSDKQTIPFDIADPKYAANYLKLLHHPLEEQGVDFWWIDWQQERTTSIPGLDPLIWLNNLHFHDLQREGSGKRGLILSRWGGWGSHRYPIQFSGDTESNWDVLKFLVPFTSTAGNVGADYWSHDLGGHFSSTGRVDPELYARWLQLGAFSAAMRVHSTSDPVNDRRPWLYGEDFERAAHAAYDLRYRLLPYIYTTARHAYDTGLPLSRPMYLLHPGDDKAYELPGQFYFGDHLLVAPAVTPGRGTTRIADVAVSLPPGEWYDLLTSERFVGPTDVLRKVPLDRIPVFCKGGVPLPMQRSGLLNAQGQIDELFVRAYPGPSATAELYEDDGRSLAYRDGGFTRTRLEQRRADHGSGFTVTVQPAEGEFPEFPERRAIVIEAPAIPPPTKVTVNGVKINGTEKAGLADSASWHYDPLSTTATVRLPARFTAEPCVVAFDVPILKDRSRAQFDRAMEWRRLLADCTALLPDDRILSNARDEIEREFRDLGPDNLADGLDALQLLVSAQRPALVAHVDKIPAENAGVVLELLLGVAFEVHTSLAEANRVRIEGELLVTEAPVFGKMEASVIPIDSVSREPLVPASGYTLLPPSYPQPFAFEIPIDPTRIERTEGWLAAKVKWGSQSVVLGRRFEWDNTFVRQWWVTGPFAGGQDIAELALAPAEDPDLDTRYVGLEGAKVGWNRVVVPTIGANGAVVNLHDLFGGDDRSAFAQTFIHAKRPVEVDLVVRHDDGAILWVNGERVYEKDEPRSISAEPGLIPLTLKKGTNRVLLKVGQHGFDWGFSLQVRPREAKALPPLHVRWHEDTE